MTAAPAATEAEHPYRRIASLLADDLVVFDAELTKVLDTQLDYLSAGDVEFYRRGKKLRPMLLLLCARLSARDPDAPVPERAIAAAVSVEVIHVGSLIHDDIIDKAPTRRGLPTISASRGYELALLIGDLQFIEAARLFASFINADDDLDLMRQFLDSGHKTCWGQIDELLSSPALDPAALTQRYFRTVDRKTGQLFSFACEAGARLGEGTPRTVGSLRRFGVLLGRAFQVMDDVLDVVRSSDAAGKEQLTDLAQGRMSLPLIYTMEEVPEDHALHRIVRGEECSDDDLEVAARAVTRGDGWIRAYSDARMIVEKAKAHLQLTPENEYRAALIDLVAHIVDQGFEEEG